MDNMTQTWRAWINSQEGRKNKIGSAEGQYLENRLWWAFMAGYDCGTAHIQPKSFPEFLATHEHEFKKTGSQPCKICGLFKASYELYLAQSL
jgi:hypothetical protein